jgi:hypothetical protein
MEDLRYPLGRLQKSPALDATGRAAAIAHIGELPAELSAAVRGLTDSQLDTPYRAGGWTVRQVVHHLADSHMNAYIRCKLLASEDNPALKGYSEDAWARMIDATSMPVDSSLAIVSGLHARWARFLESLDPAAFIRPGLHSESGPVTLDTMLQIYSWHGRHHVAHITGLRQRQGW